MTIENLCFEAHWDETTIHLAAPEETTAQKIANIAFDVFSVLFPVLGLARYVNYRLNTFANRVSLPAAHNITTKEMIAVSERFNNFWYGSITTDNSFLRENYVAIRQIVRTPDGAELHAICLQYKQSCSMTPTILYFNGNFQLSVETPTWILEESIQRKTPCNLVLFDYRGVGFSKGEFTGARDLVVDGASVVAWVKEGLGIDPSQIHFYGFSLGGAISALTKALDPKRLTGRLVNDRSFASSSAVIAARYGAGYVGRLISWLFHQYGYSATPAVALAQASGEKLVIYHPDDVVIPEVARMEKAVPQDVVFCLQPKESFEEMSKEVAHIAPLHWHEEAVEKVLSFLFAPSQEESAIEFA